MSRDPYCLGFIALTGGAAGALDAIDGSILEDGDMAFGVASGVFRAYQLDADSGLAESSPSIISPDSNAGTKRWILSGLSFSAVQSVVETLAADYEVAYSAGTTKSVLFLNPGTNTRQITLGAGFLAGHEFVVLNTGSYTLFMDPTGLNVAVGPGEKAHFYYDGTNLQ